MPACLHQEDNDLTGYAARAMGWGSTSFGGMTSSKLLHGFLSVINKNECNKHYKDEPEIPEGLISSQLCAWDENGERDTCQNDSGGPLQITRTSKDGKQFYELIGITSFGKFCANKIPGVYVKVVSYLDWIESVAWPTERQLNY